MVAGCRHLPRRPPLDDLHQACLVRAPECRYPYVTGTSVLGITYKDGVLLASDTLGKPLSAHLLVTAARRRHVWCRTGRGIDPCRLHRLLPLFRHMVQARTAALSGTSHLTACARWVPGGAGIA